MRRGLIAIVVAAALSAIVYLAAPLLPGDPLRPTLVILPLIVGALAAIGRWARRLGGRRTPPGVAAIEAVALVVLVLFACSREHLGLRYSEALVGGLLAAGFLLLLAHRVARLLLALRPVLGRRLPSTPSAVFFFLPLVVYLAMLPWLTAQRAPDGDEPYYLLVAHSLAYDFDTDLRNNYAAGDSLEFVNRRLEPQAGDPEGPGGEQLSRHNMLLPLILAPAYRLGGKHGALVIMAAFAAALGWMTLRLARHYFPRRPGEVLIAYALVAFTPPLLFYFYQAWVEVPAALLIAITLDRLLELRRSERITVRQWLWIVIPVFVLPLLKLRFVVMSASLLALGTLQSRRVRRVLVPIGLALGVAAAGIILYNQMTFGRPLKTRSWSTLALHESEPVNFLAGATGLFFDCAFGLFASSPIWMLLLPALLVWVVRREKIALHLALLFGPYLTFVVAHKGWFGAWSPPFRYALIALPLLGLSLVPLLVSRRRAGARAVLIGLASLTLLLTLLWSVVPGWTYNMADGGSHLLDRLSAGTGADVTRFFPSSIRYRAANWYWPPLSLLIVSVLWWFPRGRRSAAAVWGVVAILVLPPLLLVAARQAPTRVIEFEDPWVTHRGGELFPERWARSRQVKRGGWRLGAGQGLSVPVIAGGDRLSIVVELRNKALVRGSVGLDLPSGERVVLGPINLRRSSVWRPLRFDDVEWPPGAALSIALEPDDRDRGPILILDRALLDWD